MAHQESRKKGGFYPADNDMVRKFAALFSNEFGATTRILDPCAGHGEALEVLQDSLGATAWANELSTKNFEELRKRFDFKHAVNEDMFKLRALPMGLFGLVWNNPPYDSDYVTGRRSDRVELKALKHAYDWVDPNGGYMAWVVNIAHVSVSAAKHLLTKYAQVDVFRFDEAYLETYRQIVVVARREKNYFYDGDKEALSEDAIELHELVAESTGDLPHVEEMCEDGPIFHLPQAAHRPKMTFTARSIPREYFFKTARVDGPQHLLNLRMALSPQPAPQPLTPVTRPKIGHLAGLISAGLTDGMAIRTERGIAVVRSTVHQVETLVERTEDEEEDKTKAVYRTAPEVHITLLFETGEIEDLSGDEELAAFVQEHRDELVKFVGKNFKPLYEFDYLRDKFGKTLGRLLFEVSLKKDGEVSPLKPAQRHVVAATFAKLIESDAAILSGEPGVGKTFMAAALMKAMQYAVPGTKEWEMFSKIPAQHRMRKDQVNLVICPPHLVDKWYNEIIAMDPDAHVGRIASGKKEVPIDGLRSYFDSVEKLERQDVMKVLIVSASMMSLGEGWSPAFGMHSDRRVMPGEERRSVREYVEWSPSKGYDAGSTRQGRAFVQRTKKSVLPFGTQPTERIKCDETPSCPVTGEKLIQRITQAKKITYYKTGTLKKYRAWSNGGNTHSTNGRVRGQKKRERRWQPRKVDSGEYESVLQMENEAREFESRNVYRNWSPEEMEEQKASYMKSRMTSRRETNIRLRQRYEETRPDPQPIWQEERTFSAPKGDLRGDLQDALGLRVPVMPFPDLVLEHLADDEGKVPAMYRASKNPRAGIKGLADIIGRLYGDRIFLFIADEVHEYKASSAARGIAFTLLSNLASKSLGMTGTLYGGKASSLYQLEFMLNPKIREFYPWGSEGVNSWIAHMGVLERIVTESAPKSGASSVRRVSSSTREAPGASPLLLRLLLDHVVFVGLKDMGSEMVEFEEDAVPIQLGTEMGQMYQMIEGELRRYMDGLQSGDRASFLSVYFHTLLSWPNYPFDERKVIHRITEVDEHDNEYVVEKEVMVIPPVDDSHITTKEEWLLGVVAEELEAGRGVGVYVAQTGGKRDMLGRLSTLISENIPGAKVGVMTTSAVPTDKREAWLEKNRDKNVLLCNPRLVQTGLDLLPYQTLVFFELSYSLFTMDQASRRAWRIIQTEPCRVLYPYYFVEEAGKADTMEASGVWVVNGKREAARFLYGLGGTMKALVGNTSDNLLRAVTDAITSGEVQTLSGLFKDAAQSPDDVAEFYISQEEADSEIATFSQDSAEPSDDENVVIEEEEVLDKSGVVDGAFDDVDACAFVDDLRHEDSVTEAEDDSEQDELETLTQLAIADGVPEEDAEDYAHRLQEAYGDIIYVIDDEDVDTEEDSGVDIPPRELPVDEGDNEMDNVMDSSHDESEQYYVCETCGDELGSKPEDGILLCGPCYYDTYGDEEVSTDDDAPCVEDEYVEPEVIEEEYDDEEITEEELTPKERVAIYLAEITGEAVNDNQRWSELLGVAKCIRVTGLAGVRKKKQIVKRITELANEHPDPPMVEIELSADGLAKVMSENPAILVAALAQLGVVQGEG